MDRTQYAHSCFFGNPKSGKKAIWEITNNCNQNCLHCCNAFRRDHVDISLERAKQIVDELCLAGITRIVLSGGEPLLYKHIFELAHYIKQNNIELCFSTNGLLMEKYKDQLVELNPLKMIVSLDGFSENSHDKFRGVKGCFNSIIRSVDALYGKVKIEFHTVINKLNVGELKQLVDYSASKNIKITFSNLIQMEKNGDSYQLSDAEYNFYIERINHGFESIKKVRSHCGLLSECLAGRSIIGITSKGKYTPCLWISNFSDTFEVDDISKIPDISAMRDDIFPFCRDCTVENCGAGCAAIVMGQNIKIDPLCVKNHSDCYREIDKGGAK